MKESPEVAAKRKNLVEAMNALEGHHFVWMVDALRGHYQKQVEHSELAIARHEACASEPIVPLCYQRHDPPTRASIVAKAKASLASYRAIQLVVEELSAFVAQVGTEKVGRDVAAWLAHRGRSS